MEGYFPHMREVLGDVETCATLSVSGLAVSQQVDVGGAFEQESAGFRLERTSRAPREQNAAADPGSKGELAHRACP